jgi:hypothetical protein
MGAQGLALGEVPKPRIVKKSYSAGGAGLNKGSFFAQSKMTVLEMD